MIRARNESVRHNTPTTKTDGGKSMVGTPGSNGDRRVIRMGVIGIGGGASAMVPVFAQHPGFRWTAAADIDRRILDAFARDYEVETYTDAEAMCKSPNVDAVYVAT